MEGPKKGRKKWKNRTRRGNGEGHRMSGSCGGRGKNSTCARIKGQGKNKNLLGRTDSKTA